MKPRYYMHMGPKAAEKVSSMWKVVHITIFVLILCSASVATACIYNILDMYNFHCILYPRVSFETNIEDRVIETTTTTTTNVTIAGNDSKFMEFEQALSKGLKYRSTAHFLEKFLRKIHLGPQYRVNETNNETLTNRTGFLNMRKSIFATIYMCDLMLFAPLASIIMSVFLGAMLSVGGKGGAGNPGDVLPNPWICVYPFLALCSFMMILSFISDNLYHKGLGYFCARYYKFTKERG
ncbi:hypothetical protein ABEB36_006629 [Hypothenemus hampei]